MGSTGMIHRYSPRDANPFYHKIDFLRFAVDCRPWTMDGICAEYVSFGEVTFSPDEKLSPKAGSKSIEGRSREGR